MVESIQFRSLKSLSRPLTATKSPRINANTVFDFIASRADYPMLCNGLTQQWAIKPGMKAFKLLARYNRPVKPLKKLIP